MELYTDFKQIRCSLNLSQSELSRRSGVLQRTISRLESGLSKPELDTMVKLYKTMGLRVTFKLERI